MRARMSRMCRWACSRAVDGGVPGEGGHGGTVAAETTSGRGRAFLERAGRAGRCRRRCARKGPGRLIWSGQVRRRRRISPLSALTSCGPSQASRSRWLLCSASQSWPTTWCPVRAPSPIEVEASQPASRWVWRGRGALRAPGRCRRGFPPERFSGGAPCAVLGGGQPKGTDPVTLRERGRSQNAELSTGVRRDVKCHTDGLRRWTGMAADPVPRRTSTAKLASASTARTVVTVRGLHRAAAATRALVTAQCRPLAPSAKRARTAMTRAKSPPLR